MSGRTNDEQRQQIGTKVRRTQEGAKVGVRRAESGSYQEDKLRDESVT